MSKVSVVIFLIIFIFFKSLNGQESIFTTVESGISDYFYTTSDWGDYDNDGFIDLAISGGIDTDEDNQANISVLSIYKNRGNGNFEKIQSEQFYGLHLGTVKFADIDNDGDLDLLVTGQNYNNITKYFFHIYENNNGVYTKREEKEIEGVIFSSIDLGDYDNDGDLDILFTGGYQAHNGASKMTKIYNNNNGKFTDSGIELPAVQNGRAAFGDFDNDGKLDILIMGIGINDNYILQVYKNQGESFSLKQELPGVYNGWFDIADFNNDGFLDFAIMGDDTNDDYYAEIYKNRNGEFISHQKLYGLNLSSGSPSIAWGDFDNDGDLDLIYAGTDTNYDDITKIYENNNGTFTEVNKGQKNVNGSVSLAWIDYDNDNDLDLFINGLYTNSSGAYTAGSFLQKNNIQVPNQKPNPPTNLSSVKNNDNSITFKWEGASDDITPTIGLQYILNVGTTNGATDVASYKVHGNQWTIKNLTENEYFFDVIAIDGAKVKSDRSASASTLSTINQAIKKEELIIYSSDKTIFFKGSFIDSNNNIDIKVFSTNGTMVYNGKLKNNQLMLKKLNKGIYFIELIGQDKKINKNIMFK